MIQRIQSIYLLVSAILAGIALFQPLGLFIAPDAVSNATFSPLRVMQADGSCLYTIGVFGILLIASIATIAAIFLYKNRMLQIRVTNFATLLFIGYYVVTTIFIFTIKSDIAAASFRPCISLCFPLISIILNYMAFRAIYRDEVMVRAADRIR